MGITAIFGGTFNPPHIGHYEMLRSLENNPDIEEIMLLPDRIPPHKVCDFLASDSDRINMCRLLSADFKKAALCLIEFEREGKSYSIDTVRLLKRKYPQKSFAFVCGGDMLISFDKWYKYEELLREIPFIVFRREVRRRGNLTAARSILYHSGWILRYRRTKYPPFLQPL